MTTLSRPPKHAYGTKSYVGELNAAAPNDALIYASDVDGDLDPLYAAYNNLTALPPNGPAGGDLTGSTYPNPVIAPGVVTVAKLAAGVLPTTLPPSGAAGGDLAGSTYPNPVIAPGAVTNAKVNDVAWGKITGAPTSLPPSGPAGGDLAGSTYPNPKITAAALALDGARIMRSTTQPLPNATWTVTVFDTDVSSGQVATNLWNAGTPDRIIVQRAGLYLCGGTMTLAGSNAGALRMLQLSATSYPVYMGAPVNNPFLNVNGVFALAASAVVQLLVYQDSGVAMTIDTAVRASLWVIRLG